jgi:hypothetical protein
MDQTDGEKNVGRKPALAIVDVDKYGRDKWFLGVRPPLHLNNLCSTQ